MIQIDSYLILFGINSFINLILEHKKAEKIYIINFRLTHLLRFHSLDQT